MANKNFEIKNGLTVAGTERITSAGLVTGTTTTQAASDNTTKLASTAYVTTALANLSDSAPSTLNTLNELAAALGDDANYATTTTNAIAAKLPLAGGSLTGSLDISGGTVNGTSFADNRLLRLQNTSTTDGSRMGIAFQGNSSIGSGLAWIEGVNYDQSIGATDIRFSTYSGSAWNADMMTLSNNGNVGIGLTSPQRKLVLYQGDSGQTQIQFQNVTTGSVAGDGFGVGLDSAEKGFIWNYEGNDTYIGGAGGTSITIQNGGNVGIGNTSPATNLHIGSGTAGENLGLKINRGSTTNFLVACDGTKQAYIGVDNTQGFIKMGSLSNHPVSISQNNGNVIYIDTSNNVGIGTDSPSAAVPLTAYYSSTSQFHVGGAQAGISNNVYYNGSAYTNRNTGAGGALLQLGTDGSFAFRRATSGSSPTLTYSMYIDANGNVGIGESTPSKLGLTGSSAGKVLHMGGDDCQVRLANTILHHDNSGNTTTHLRNHYGATDALAKMKFEAGYFSFCTGTSFDEKMRLKGNTLYVSTDIGAHTGGSINGNSYAHNTYAHAGVFGANSVPDGTLVVEDYDVSSGIGNTVLKCYLRDQDPATSATFIDFADGGGRVGSVTHNDDGGGVSFNTTSDYRLKENVNYTWDATTLLKQLKPAKFNFKRNPAKTVQGMLAHEVMDIVPSSVRGDKDHMEPIGAIKDSGGEIVHEGVYEHFTKTDQGQTWEQTGTEPLYQELDYSRLVPLLVKTIQELEARISTLEG